MRRRIARKGRDGFTLVELLVVVGVVAVLASVLVPSLAAAKQRARVARVHADLKGIGDALESYALELKVYPPVRLSCNYDMVGHEYQLPVELADAGYLRRGGDLQHMVEVRDAFHESTTYKYNAPGDMILNNVPQKNANAVWVPDAFPDDDGEGELCDRSDGTRYTDPRHSPVAWVLWSVGPDPDCEKVSSARAPISRRTWYAGGGEGGVICRIMASDGAGLSTSVVCSP